MCSSAMPALFPYQTTSFSSSGKNSTYVDGGVIINLDVSTPIQWCLDQGFKREEIYVDILFDSNVASYDDNFTPKNTIDLLAQVNDLKSHYSGFNYASNVMNAFPEVNYRYIVIPREPLTSTFIFNELAIEYLISDGKKDGEYYAKMGPSKEMI